MAFTFIVEEGTADPDANSYTSIDFADDYIDSNIYASADWLALPDATKERLLSRASKIIDARAVWEGERLDEDSGLRWPRCGVYDRDGFLIAEDIIPIVLQEAVAEFAAYLMQMDWTAPRSADQFRELQVGPIDIKYDSTYQQASIPDTVIMLLHGLGSFDSGKRPNFKKIVRT